MKVICIDSTDPKEIRESLMHDKIEEAVAVRERDELRAKFASTPSLWFEVVSDDYTLRAPLNEDGELVPVAAEEAEELESGE